jgi:putative nucleotidyltransferase with HDIG domain
MLMTTFIETISEDKVERSEFRDTLDGTIHAVSSLVGIRDPYTADHQQRVGVLAGFIAKEIGLSDWQVKGIYVAGLLHDIGKAAAPLEILNKPGKLSASEFDVVKNHSQVGYDILKEIDFPWSITEAILQHHERLDGSGYPRGLSGHEVILEARILGVVDVVDAMCYSRPYRPALGLEAALNEIRSGSGTRYDTHIVNACLKLLGQDTPESDKVVPAAAIGPYSLSRV